MVDVDSFSKIINSHNQIGIVAYGPRKRTNDIYPPLFKRPRRSDRDRKIGRLMMFRSVVLARRAVKD